MRAGSPGSVVETANALPYFKEDQKMEEITQIISSVGFPIAMSLLLFWYLQQESKSHKEETQSLKDAINELKLAITSLINKLED